MKTPNNFMNRKLRKRLVNMKKKTNLDWNNSPAWKVAMMIKQFNFHNGKNNIKKLNTYFHIILCISLFIFII